MNQKFSMILIVLSLLSPPPPFPPLESSLPSTHVFVPNHQNTTRIILNPLK
ncbi:hypothetical protein BVRB_7g168130 [Beta vulgaris subsp. vulgaris]|uniref:Uncharacterized protein n=1 Tax=Beta vulgaris subsp. vulgaris TaxID=3555 RepID=A0A0J8BWN8_BETVV|nr:hypothetical protein BVRB_7g168130 [Beta vulgaris subsp. vulgaris]